MKQPRPPHDQQSSLQLWRGDVAVASLLLFASGVAGLVYQLLWIKQLSLIVGVDVYAITIAISAFFAGLAGGSLWLGRRADRSTRPLLFYAALEAGIAVLAVAATIALAHSAFAFARLEAMAGPFAWLLPFFMVAVPAVLMGGTVPVLVRALSPDQGQLARTGGVLYAANTTGAIVGTVLTVFALIPTFGVRGSALVAAAMNLLAAGGAWLLSRAPLPASPRFAEEEARAEVELKEAASLPTSRRFATGREKMPFPVSRGRAGWGQRELALTLYAIAGGVALGYEVIWSQTIVQWTSTRSVAFAIALATYLIGLAVGSAVCARHAARIRNPWGALGLLIAAAGTFALLAVMALGDWLHSLQVTAATLAFNLTHHESVAMAARFSVAAAWVVLMPTLLLGAAFPLALRLAADASTAGRDTGAVIAFNTLGGIAGTALAGFVLVPVLGVERSLALMAIAACVIGAVAVMQGSSTSPAPRWAMAICAVLAVLGAVKVSPDHLATLLAESRRGELIFFEPDAGGTVAVIEQGTPKNRFRRLYIDGVSNSGDSMTSLRYMRLQALLPLIIHNGEPRSALVIGLGTGITSGALLAYPDLETRVVAELLPGVTAAARLFDGNYQVAADDRVEIRLRDGRRELLRSDQQYDLITLEPPPPSARGVVNLYSTDFYQLAARRLNDDGLLAQWLPLPTQIDADTRSLVRSFIDVFPHATLWSTEMHEMLLIGSKSPIELDAARIAARFQQPQVVAALREVGIASPQALLAIWVTDRAGLERYAGNAAAVTDDDPRIEYGPWVLPDEFARQLPGLLALQTEPVIAGADAAFQGSVRSERDRLLRFYSAGLHAYRNERGAWADALRAVLEEDPTNPYYRWAAGLH